MIAHIQFMEDILDICRKSIQVLLKVFCDMVGVVAQLCQRVFAGVVKLMPRNPLHGFGGVIGILLVGLHNLGLCGFQCALKPLHNLGLRGFQCALKTPDDGHGNNHVAVFVRHIGTPELVGDAPYKIGFGRNIYRIVIPQKVKFLWVSHGVILLNLILFQIQYTFDNR